MIKTNLAVLMAERGLKISDVYQDTGISKTTLMAISENSGKGIQYETIDKLCNYFNVTPADFFIYYPFRIFVNWYDSSNGILDNPNIENDLSDLAITLQNNDISDTYIFNFVVVPKDSYRIPANYRNKIDFGVLMGNWESLNNENNSHKIDFMNEFIKKMPIQFFNDFRKQIDNKVKANIDNLSFGSGKLILAEPSFELDKQYEIIQPDSDYRIYTDYSYNDNSFGKDKILNIHTIKLPF